jgi:hypothetical protein
MVWSDLRDCYDNQGDCGNQPADQHAGILAYAL